MSKQLPRTFKIGGGIVSYIELTPYKNHSKTQYTERNRGWSEGFKPFLYLKGWLWKIIGLRAM